jgi:hypothetical protein
MTQVDYQRSTGKTLTYRIEADQRGGFKVWLDGELLLKGRDALSAHGRNQRPGPRKEAGAVAAAREAIETLRDMSED